MKILKRISAMGAAVMMMASVSTIGASVYSYINIYETKGNTTNTTCYISCYRNGAFTNGYVSGMAWTKTSSKKR